MTDVFVSAAHEAAGIADQLRDLLVRVGLEVSPRLFEAEDKSVPLTPVVILLVNKNEPDWAQREEWRIALNAHWSPEKLIIELIPVLLPGVRKPEALASITAIRLSRDEQRMVWDFFRIAKRAWPTVRERSLDWESLPFDVRMEIDQAREATSLTSEVPQESRQVSGWRRLETKSSQPRITKLRQRLDEISQLARTTPIEPSESADVEELERTFEHTSDASLKTSAAFDLGVHFRRRGEYSLATNWLNIAMALANNSQLDSLVFASAYNLALAEKELGEDDEAIRLLESITSIDATGPADRSVLAAAAYELASLVRGSNRRRARSLLEKALESATALLGERDPITQEYRVTLAALLENGPAIE